jgi:hypothetical protein
MSTAAPTKNATPAAVPTAASSGYEVGKPQGKCAVCAEVIPADEKFMAVLRETPTGFERVDCMLACWEKLDRQNVVAFWKTTMPKPDATKRKLFVDDEVLCSLFERLAEVAEPAKLSFRFVLGLILMRKRLLVYEGSRKEGEGASRREIWSMRFKGREDAMELLNPQLTEEQVGEVSRQMGEILNEEL